MNQRWILNTYSSSKVIWSHDCENSRSPWIDPVSNFPLFYWFTLLDATSWDLASQNCITNESFGYKRTESNTQAGALFLGSAFQLFEKCASVEGIMRTSNKTMKNEKATMAVQYERKRKEVGKETHCLAAWTICAFRSHRLASCFYTLSSHTTSPPSYSSRMSSALFVCSSRWYRKISDLVFFFCIAVVAAISAGALVSTGTRFRG